MMMLGVVLFLCQLVMAQSNSTAYTDDPILQYRPPFAQSLPVQILVTGIALTLAVVLLLHLIFTAQYHWPLARTNYVLQITGVVTLLVSISATIYVIFTTTIVQSQHWPYMLNYLAVDMPATNSTLNSTDPTLLYQQKWTPAESATWVVMNATTSVVVQVRLAPLARPPSHPLIDHTHPLPHPPLSLRSRGQTHLLSSWSVFSVPELTAAHMSY